MAAASSFLVSDTRCGKAIRAMQEYDPDFDIEELCFESEEVFKEFFCNYLAGNLKYIEMVCGNTALALTKSSIQLREKEGWKYKYEELLNNDRSQF